MRTAMHVSRFVLILAFLASLLSVSGASASTGTAISGTETILLAGPTDRLWMSGKWTHVKGDLNTGGWFDLTGDGISLSGSVTRLDNVKTDADGNGTLHGIITYEATNGVVCQGPSNGKLTMWAFAGSVDAHCSDGSTLHGYAQDTGVIFDSSVPPNLIGVTGTFNGTLFGRGQ